MSISSLDRSRPVVAFDGDDTLWIDDTDEKRWERDCKRLSVEGLPHPEMAEAKSATSSMLPITPSPLP